MNKLIVIVILLNIILDIKSFITNNNKKIINKSLYSITINKPISKSSTIPNLSFITNEPISKSSSEGLYYVNTPNSSKQQFSSKLTWNNKKYLDLGLKLRMKYRKLRLLSSKEEIIAGKFSFIGKRLEDIKKSLTLKLNREPSDIEWSTTCNLTINQLHLYMQLAKKARQRLIQHNIRLVDFWTRKLIENTKVGKEISYYELIIEGIIGLTKAAERYDGRGRFSYFAQVYIRSDLYKAITKLRPGSLASHNSVMWNNRVNKMKYQLYQKLNRYPTDEEIADTMKIKVTTLQSIRNLANKQVISAETQLGTTNSKEESSNTYYDLYIKPDSENFNTETTLWKSDFYVALQSLEPQERRILDIRYGLSDGISRTVERTAELMCVTPESIRKIIIKSLEKLRKSSSADVLLAGPPKMNILTKSGRLEATIY